MTGPATHTGVIDGPLLATFGSRPVDTSAGLHVRMLEDPATGLALSGQTLPGPIPADEAKDIS